MEVRKGAARRKILSNPTEEISCAVVRRVTVYVLLCL